MPARLNLSSPWIVLLCICGGILVVAVVAALQLRVVLEIDLSPRAFTIPLIVGAVAGALIGLGITRMVRSNQQATLAVRRLSAVVDTAVDGIITINEMGVIETANPATEAIFGYRQSEMLGRNVNLLMPAPHRQQHDGYIADYIRTGQRKIIGIGREVEGLRKDGALIPLELSVAESILDDRRLFTGIVRDITARKESESALRESKSQISALLEAIPDAIARVADDGTYLYVKEPLDHQTVVPADQMVGRTIRDILAPELAAQLTDALALAQSTQQLQIFDYTIAIAGELRSREARIMPSQGKEATMITRDVTEQKQAEREKSAAVTAERDRIARDLHDSVTQTLFSASMIADVLPMLWEMDTAAAMERLGELRELTRGALAEMRTLLLELRPSFLIEAELDQLLQQLLDAVIGRARVRGDLRIDGQVNALPQEVHIAIYRTVQEALNNIAKHAQATHVSIALKRHQERLELSIRDDGRGFEMTAPSGGHFGINNMKERIEEIGGTITLESRAEHGTTITIGLQSLPPVT